MRASRESPLTIVDRRRARRLAYWNGVLWALGNGLVGTTLVVYLAFELRAPQIGLGIGLILAMRHVVGLLRLGAPAIIGRLAGRKPFCLASFLLGALTLLPLPWLAAPGTLPGAGQSLAALVALWCVYHLLQYLGTIALWSWFADLVPREVRGRFFGLRQRWIVAGEAAATLCGASFVWGWAELNPFQARWIAYGFCAVLGAGFMLAAVVPLARMPAAGTGRAAGSGASLLRTTFAPLADRRFLRLLIFGCWFSFSNGLTQSAQFSYPSRVLAVGLAMMLLLQTGMRLGQWSISPAMGRLADRLGNRTLMFACLLATAQGPLFYLVSTPQRWWWFAGAWAAWIFYAGINVGLPNLLLKLAPERSNTPHIALFAAITGLCYAANTVFGGMLYDRYHLLTARLPGGIVVDYYQAVFLAGWIARNLGLLALWAVVEPPSRP